MNWFGELVFVSKKENFKYLANCNIKLQFAYLRKLRFDFFEYMNSSSRKWRLSDANCENTKPTNFSLKSKLEIALSALDICMEKV